MLVTPEYRKIVLALAALVSIVISLSARKGRRVVALIGSMTTFLGIVSLLSGQLMQRWHGGPPLEGSFATFATFVILCVGFYALFLAFFQKSADQSQSGGSATDLTKR